MDLTGTGVLRGDVTGWGIIEGIVPPRLEGGATNAFIEYPDGDTRRADAAFGGVDDAGVVEEVNDFNAFERGIDEGEKLRAENDMSKSNESIDEDEETLCCDLGFENEKGTSASSSSSKGTKTGAGFLTGARDKGASV